MAYSNINRDKKQTGRAEKVKNLVFVVFLLVITTTSLLNIYRQWSTLNRAEARNHKLETEIASIEAENQLLRLKSAEATKSAYIDRKLREYFGLGTANDYWLILPPEDKNLELNQEVNVDNSKPLVLEWWELFFPLR